MYVHVPRRDGMFGIEVGATKDGVKKTYVVHPKHEEFPFDVDELRAKPLRRWIYFQVGIGVLKCRVQKEDTANR